MQVRFHRKFEKRFFKLSPKIQDVFHGKLEIFYENKFDVRLNNHSLGGVHKDKRSINITGDMRAIFKESENEEIVFLLIGGHSELYS